MPDGSSDGLLTVSLEVKLLGMRKETYAHAKGTTEIVEDDIGTRVASVIHYVWLAVKKEKGVLKRTNTNGERSEDNK